MQATGCPEKNSLLHSVISMWHQYGGIIRGYLIGFHKNVAMHSAVITLHFIFMQTLPALCEGSLKCSVHFLLQQKREFDGF